MQKHLTVLLEILFPYLDIPNHHTHMVAPNTWTCTLPIMEPAFEFHAKEMALHLQEGFAKHSTLPCYRHPSLQYPSNAS